MVPWGPKARQQLSQETFEDAHRIGFSVVADFSFEGYDITEENFNFMSAEIAKTFRTFLLQFRNSMRPGDSVSIGSVYDPIPRKFSTEMQFHLFSKLFNELLLKAKESVPEGVEVGIFLESLWLAPLKKFVCTLNGWMFVCFHSSHKIKKQEKKSLCGFSSIFIDVKKNEKGEFSLKQFCCN